MRLLLVNKHILPHHFKRYLLSEAANEGRKHFRGAGKSLAETVVLSTYEACRVGKLRPSGRTRAAPGIWHTFPSIVQPKLLDRLCNREQRVINFNLSLTA